MKAKIKIESGLTNNSIELIQSIEKDLDKLLVSHGFKRSETTKACDFVQFEYSQFGVCNPTEK